MHILGLNLCLIYFESYIKKTVFPNEYSSSSTIINCHYQPPPSKVDEAPIEHSVGFNKSQPTTDQPLHIQGRNDGRIDPEELGNGLYMILLGSVVDAGDHCIGRGEIATTTDFNVSSVPANFKFYPFRPLHNCAAYNYKPAIAYLHGPVPSTPDREQYGPTYWAWGESLASSPANTWQVSYDSRVNSNSIRSDNLEKIEHKSLPGIPTNEVGNSSFSLGTPHAEGVYPTLLFEFAKDPSR